MSQWLKTITPQYQRTRQANPIKKAAFKRAMLKILMQQSNKQFNIDIAESTLRTPVVKRGHQQKTDHRRLPKMIGKDTKVKLGPLPHQFERKKDQRNNQAGQKLPPAKSTSNKQCYKHEQMDIAYFHVKRHKQTRPHAKHSTKQASPTAAKNNSNVISCQGPTKHKVHSFRGISQSYGINWPAESKLTT